MPRLKSYFRFSSPPPEGEIAAASLFFIPAGIWLFGRIASWWDADYRADGAVLGAITFYALSVGFGISACRQTEKRTRIWGTVTLALDFLIFVPLFGSPIC